MKVEYNKMFEKKEETPKKRNILQRAGDWYEEIKEEHPVAVITVKTFICAAVLGFIYNKGKQAGHERVVYKDNPVDKEALYKREIQDQIDCNQSEIDEEIYTDLASDLEKAVLKEGLDEWYDHRVFDVLYAKYGDPLKGTYTAKKEVTVNVRDITDCEEETNESGTDEQVEVAS